MRVPPDKEFECQHNPFSGEKKSTKTLNKDKVNAKGNRFGYLPSQNLGSLRDPDVCTKGITDSFLCFLMFTKPLCLVSVHFIDSVSDSAYQIRNLSADIFIL